MECFGEPLHGKKKYILGCVENTFLNVYRKQTKVVTGKSVSLKPHGIKLLFIQITTPTSPTNNDNPGKLSVVLHYRARASS